MWAMASPDNQGQYLVDRSKSSRFCPAKKIHPKKGSSLKSVHKAQIIKKGGKLIMADNDNGVNVGAVLLSFLAGAAAGAGVAMLTAPKTGKELRGKMKDLADEAVGKIKEYTSEAQEKIKTSFEDGKEMLQEKKSIITSAIEAGKEAMEREKERLKNV
jgi:gas vesicle protein